MALTVDDVPDPTAGAAGVRFMEIRGIAEQVELETPPFEGTSRWIIRIHPGGSSAGTSARPECTTPTWPVADRLHGIHQRLHASADRGESRYEIVRVLAPAPDVVVAQVRRTALDEHGEAIRRSKGRHASPRCAARACAPRRRLVAGRRPEHDRDRGQPPRGGTTEVAERRRWSIGLAPFVASEERLGCEHARWHAA